jgi:hypothetical protein
MNTRTNAGNQGLAESRRKFSTNIGLILVIVSAMGLLMGFTVNLK